MAGKKKKYNARFPPARIKKIMQMDEEVGKIAAAVPVVISRALELFLDSIITDSVAIANESNAKTLSCSHIKSVIQSTPAFDFLKSQVLLVPDLNADGAETSSAHSSDRRGSSAKLSLTASSSSSLPTATSTNDNAQSSHPVLTKKRPRPLAATSKTEVSESGDGVKIKRKRGRPPKIRPTETSNDIKPDVKRIIQPLGLAVPNVKPQLLPFEQKANGETKGVKVELGTNITDSKGNAAPTTIIQPKPLAPNLFEPKLIAAGVVQPKLVPISVAMKKEPIIPETRLMSPLSLPSQPGAPNIAPPALIPRNSAETGVKPSNIIFPVPHTYRTAAPTCTVAPTLPLVRKPPAPVDTDIDPPVESIFHTSTTIGIPPHARARLQQHAHTANNIRRHYGPSHALNLSYAKVPSTGSGAVCDKLSPNSQPMDLSTKIDAPRPMVNHPQSTNAPLLTSYNSYTTPSTLADTDNYDA